MKLFFVYGELERNKKKRIVTCFKVLCRCIWPETDKNHE